jgi:hypothetical protein
MVGPHRAGSVIWKVEWLSPVFLRDSDSRDRFANDRRIGCDSFQRRRRAAPKHRVMRSTITSDFEESTGFSGYSGSTGFTDLKDMNLGREKSRRPATHHCMLIR